MANVGIERKHVGMAFALLLGVVALMLSAESDRLWTSFGLFLLGMALVSVPLLSLNDLLAVELTTEQPDEFPWWYGSIAAGGLLLAGAALWRGWFPVIAAAGVIALTVGLIGLHVWFSRDLIVPGGQVSGVRPETGGDVKSVDDLTVTEPMTLERQVDPRPLPLGGKTWVGLELLVVGVGAAWLGSGAVAVVGALVWVAGLMIVKIGVADFLDSRRGRFGPTIRVLVDIVIVGFVVLVAGSVTSSSGLVWLGATVVIVALSVLGLAATYCDCSVRRATWLLLGGGGAIMLLTIWVMWITRNWQLGIVVGLLVAAVGMWFVFRGEGIVLLLLVAYVLSWGLVDRSAGMEANPHEENDLEILSIGDSFISGEGAAKYLEGTNDVGAERNECRRAASSYSYRLAKELPASLDFVACSGAKIDDLFVCGQMSPDAERCKDPGEWAQLITDGEVGGAPEGQLPQLLNFDESELQAFDLVLMSIGGNDVGFSSIVKACLLPKGCEERSTLWLDNVELLGSRLEGAYRGVQRRVAAGTPIIVFPYPNLVSDESCGLGLSKPEHVFVDEFIKALNAEIEDAAARANVLYFRPSETAFDDVQMCDDPAGANHLELSPPEGGWLARYSPATWIHNSMHPNELGHTKIFERLEPSVRSLLADELPGDELMPGVVAADSVSGVERENAEEAADLLTDSEWINDELFRTVRALVLPLVLLLVAGLLFAVGVVQRGGVVSEVLRPRESEL